MKWDILVYVQTCLFFFYANLGRSVSLLSLHALSEVRIYILTAPHQFDAWISICYLIQEKIVQFIVVRATLEITLHLPIFSCSFRCSIELCVTHVQTCQKPQSTMAWSQIDQTRPDHSTKPPHLQPPSLLCFTDMAVPSEHTPLGHSQSNQPISTSHQLLIVGLILSLICVVVFVFIQELLTHATIFWILSQHM